MYIILKKIYINIVAYYLICITNKISNFNSFKICQIN